MAGEAHDRLAGIFAATRTHFNLMINETVQVTKVTVASMAGISAWAIANDVAISLFNVQLSTVAMAATGALLSLSYANDNEPKLKRRNVYLSFVANTLFAASAVAVFPSWLGWDWYSNKIEGSVALLMAASARFMVPALIKLPGELLRKWFKLKEPRTDEGVDGYEK